MNHSIYLESLLCSAIFFEQKRSGNFPLLYFNEKKAMQCYLLQKTFDFVNSDKKNP